MFNTMCERRNLKVIAGKRNTVVSERGQVTECWVTLQDLELEEGDYFKYGT